MPIFKRSTTHGTTHKETGQALIEFAFIAPFVLVLLLTIVDFAIAVDRREVVQHAVREGARQGAVGATTAEIENATIEQSQGTLSAPDIDVCYLPGSGGTPAAGEAGSFVRVSASYSHDVSLGASDLLGFFGLADALDIQMTPDAEAYMDTAIVGAVPC